MIALRVANDHVKVFAAEADVIKDHREAMDSLDCEAFLQLGIDAYDWVVRADRAIRKAVLSGQLEYDKTIDVTLENMLHVLIKAYDHVGTWIKKVEERGYVLDNISRFRESELQARAMAKFLSGDELTDAMRAVRDDALSEHANGKTAAFV